MFKEKEFDHQWRIISRGAVELLPEDEFAGRIKESIRDNAPLRVKQGFDPTAPDIHLGHTVGIRKLRQFQDLGHQIVLIVGDYTALVGDPSGRSVTRPQLLYDQIMANAETYQKQFFKILDKSKTEIHYNGEWFAKMSFQEIIHLASKLTVARILERDDFDIRFKSGSPISIHELIYPLMQAYDSVAIKADIEIGATEQKFNLLTGREIQQDYGQVPQVVLTLPVLAGLDGHQRMSKSTGNYIGIDEPPGEIYGKVMSIPDSLIYPYYELATDISFEELASVKTRLEDDGVNPMDIKRELASKLVRMYYDDAAATKAGDDFRRVFTEREIPNDVPEFDCNAYDDEIWIVQLLTDTGLVGSRG